jgi:SAM-dependent methyltransferase
MHNTSFYTAKLFIDKFVKSGVVLEIGSKDNPELREILPEGVDYIGSDIEDGINVTHVFTDPYVIDLPDRSVDYIISSSCFEHSEFFWELALEIFRVLKVGGLFYMNVPSSGKFHKFPVDCWRFYPDSAQALQNWGRKKNQNIILLEQFTSLPTTDDANWFDYVAVFEKLENVEDEPKNDQRLIDDENCLNFINGSKWPNLNEYINYFELVNSQGVNIINGDTWESSEDWFNHYGSIGLIGTAVVKKLS